MSRPTVLAAGGVLWRGDPSDPEVAVVHRPRYDDWSLPKGKAKPSEHLLVTGLREMAEETGYQPRIGPYLVTVRYRVTSGGHPVSKLVTYWSMRCAGGSFRASSEVDELKWLGLDDALPGVTSASDRAVLDRFARIRRDTEVMLLVRRGATASPTGRLKGPPEAQRLNRSGRTRAASLVPVLDGLGATDLLSADTPACVGMLAPFAAATGQTVRREARLTRSGFSRNESNVADQVRRVASSSPVLVVCGEQPVITGLINALGHVSDVSPPAETKVKKGGWWLLHHRDGAVTAYERHEPTP
jgi:8-oxo-(d)GTP phosphatase